MGQNRMNDRWLRPFLAILVLAGVTLLAGCGGGSGAPNNPFAPGPPVIGPLFVLPPAATVYAHTPATLTVTGGAPPYSAFSSNTTILPVAQAVGSGTIVLLPADVAADTVVIITVQDSIGQTATSTVTVRPAPLFNTLTVVPDRSTCGANAVCSGDTATATVQVLGPQGAPIPNRQVKFDVVTGAYGIQTNNPGQPLAASVTVVSDAAGFARVVLQAAVNVPTQPAILRATDLTTGNSVTAAFTIVQQTDGSAILSVVPGDATITGADTQTCSFGFRVDYFIYGGTPPYHISSTFPDAVTLVNPTVFASGGFFEAITNGTCVKPLTFTIVDAIGRQTTATLNNIPGTNAPPAPPGPPITVTPGSISAGPGVNSCSGKTFNFVISGGTPPFSVASPGGIVVPNPVATSPGSFSISNFADGSGTHTIFIGDASVPQQTATASVTCK
jgi:hypothetical protein